MDTVFWQILNKINFKKKILFSKMHQPERVTKHLPSIVNWNESMRKWNTVWNELYRVEMGKIIFFSKEEGEKLEINLRKDKLKVSAKLQDTWHGSQEKKSRGPWRVENNVEINLNTYSQAAIRTWTSVHRWSTQDYTRETRGRRRMFPRGREMFSLQCMCGTEHCPYLPPLCSPT